MDDKKRMEVAALLKAKGATMPCQRCGGQKFDIIGPGLVALSDGPVSATTPAVPTVLVGCTNCGCVTQHAQVLLGLAK